jgi:hypothetical protein
MEFGQAKTKIYADGTLGIIRNLGGGGKIDVGVRGYGRIIKLNPYGEIVQDTDWCKNNFTAAGMAYCVQLVGGISAPAAMDYLAVGTSAQAESDADTALIAEIVDSGLVRAQDATPSASQTTEPGDTLEINYSWSVTGTKVIAEIGLLNASSTGTLIGRTVLAATVPVANLDVANGLYKVVYA